ncbi:MAG: CobW family GTP-binding protein, partial [Bacillota bacterium]
MIQLVLLTGFLGAGKTTLMTSILEAYQDKKIGVIINEFGKINIDARLIEKDGIEMAELSNGSIFCACIKDKFLYSLIEFSHMDIEYLFIEASGLADPVNMPQILKAIQQKTGTPYHYRGALCIVDGESFLDLVDMLPALERQVEYSDVMVLNKADLISESKIVEISEMIQKMNPKAQIFVTSYCRVDIAEIVEDMEPDEKEGRETTNTFESRPNTLVLTAENMIPVEDLNEFLEDISGYTYRIKGFSETDHGPMEISVVGKNIHLNPWHTDVKGSQIVVISAVGIRIMSVVTSALEKKLKGKLHL